MKTIIVQWVKEEKYGYGKAMRVVVSDHERFTIGSRFDFGFFSIATDEGYQIISLPVATPEPTRYFKARECYWKFEPGKPVMIRLAEDGEWQESIFGSLAEFLADPGQPTEITAEEGEP